MVESVAMVIDEDSGHTGAISPAARIPPKLAKYKAISERGGGVGKPAAPGN